MELGAEPVEPPRQRLGIWLLLVLAITAFAVVGIRYLSQPRNNDDPAVKRQLEQLGGLVVLDAKGAHVASVNLSTVTDPVKLREALELLPKLTRITALDVSRLPIRDDDLDIIGRLRTLNSLGLSTTEISDAGMEHLLTLSALESLQLARTAITPAAIPSIASLRGLKVLDLSSTSVTSGLEPLSNLPELQWLVLSKLTLDEGALAPLASLPQLKRLTLIGSEYSQESAAQLQQARPNMTIDH